MDHAVRESSTNHRQSSIHGAASESCGAYSYESEAKLASRLKEEEEEEEGEEAISAE